MADEGLIDSSPGRAFHQAGGVPKVTVLRVQSVDDSGNAFAVPEQWHAEGPPPRTGQLFLALDPGALAGPSFAERIENLCAAMLEDPAVRLPGERRLESRRRLARDGIPVPAKLLAELRQRAAA